MKAETNTQEIYVVNLDKNRVMIVTGLLLLLAGLLLFAGIALGKRSTVAREPDLPLQEESSPIEAAVQEPTEVLPHVGSEILPPVTVEENAVLEPGEKLPVESDPFVKAPPSTVEKASAGTFYTIQVAAYRQESDARHLVSRLSEKGIQARIDRGTLYWFVRVGKTENKSNLEREVEKLRSLNYNVLVKKVVS